MALISQLRIQSREWLGVSCMCLTSSIGWFLGRPFVASVLEANFFGYSLSSSVLNGRML
jgi:hypothetical protein